MSGAANKLHVSQPSLSMAVKRLEQKVGAALFIRHKHGLTLTQVGKQLFVSTKQLLQDWERMKSQSLSYQNEMRGTVSIGVHSLIAIYTVAEALSDILTTYPQLDLNLTHAISQEISEKVINLSMDMGIVANPFKHKDLVIKKLCDDEVGFWNIKNSKITNKTSLLCDPSYIQTQSLLKQCRKKGVIFDRIIPMNNLEAIAMLIANGSGVGILPKRIAYAMYPKILRQIPKTPIYLDEICLIYRNENRNVQTIKILLEKIKNSYLTASS